MPFCSTFTCYLCCKIEHVNCLDELAELGLAMEIWQTPALGSLDQGVAKVVGSATVAS